MWLPKSIPESVLKFTANDDHYIFLTKNIFIRLINCCRGAQYLLNELNNELPKKDWSRMLRIIKYFLLKLIKSVQNEDFLAIKHLIVSITETYFLLDFRLVGLVEIIEKYTWSYLLCFCNLIICCHLVKIF